MKQITKVLHILIFALISIVIFVSCGQISPNDLNTTTSTKVQTNDVTPIPSNIPENTAIPEQTPSSESSADPTPSEELDVLSTKSKPVTSPGSCVKSTQPADQAKDVLTIDITIVFTEDMDEATLNSQNIVIYEGKHNGIISDLFNYVYDKKSRTLHISFKVPDNSYGSGNGITVFLTKRVCSSLHKSIGDNFYFGFSTP